MTTVSVCMPTYRRPKQLRDALERLFQLKPPTGGFEIVVVDDGSPAADGVTAVLDELSALAPIPLRWEASPYNQGPGATRNVAWRLAEGDWIAFTDDDCRPEVDWLVGLLERAHDVGADVVQGRTVPDPEKEHLLAEPFSRSIRVDRANEYYQTCNIAYRRSLIEQLGGFDERFRHSGEDTDLGWRAVEAGAKVAFASEAVVFHDVAVVSWRADLRGRRRWGDVVTVIAKHPGARRLAWKPYIYRPTHMAPLALAGILPLTASRAGRRLAAAAVVAFLVRAAVRSPSHPFAGVVRRVGDCYEVAVLLRASAKDRTLLL